MYFYFCFIALATDGSVIGGVVAKKMATAIEFRNFMPGMTPILSKYRAVFSIKLLL